MPSSASATVTKMPKQRKGAASKGSGKDDAAAAADANDFFWTYTEEPHRTRRIAIIKAHPEVCDLAR